jgi:hypothetical protein
MSCLTPPAQNRTCGFPAYGSHLGCLTAKRSRGQGCRIFSLATCRTRASPWVTLVRSCARSVRCRPAFPSAPALGSADSDGGWPPPFAGFIATMAGPDLSRPFIAGYGSSPSRHGPARLPPPGQTRDIPSSSAVLSCVMRSSTPAERQPLAWRCRTCCLRRCLPSRPLRISEFRSSITHPTQSLCTLRSRRRRRPRNTRYRAPATAYPDRSFTGWTTPASWRTSNPEEGQGSCRHEIASLRSQ